MNFFNRGGGGADEYFAHSMTSATSRGVGFVQSHTNNSNSNSKQLESSLSKKRQLPAPSILSSQHVNQISAPTTGRKIEKNPINISLCSSTRGKKFPILIESARNSRLHSETETNTYTSRASNSITPQILSFENASSATHSTQATGSSMKFFTSQKKINHLSSIIFQQESAATAAATEIVGSTAAAVITGGFFSESQRALLHSNRQTSSNSSSTKQFAAVDVSPRSLASTSDETMKSMGLRKKHVKSLSLFNVSKKLSMDNLEIQSGIQASTPASPYIQTPTGVETESASKQQLKEMSQHGNGNGNGSSAKRNTTTKSIKKLGNHRKTTSYIIPNASNIQNQNQNSTQIIAENRQEEFNHGKSINECHHHQNGRDEGQGCLNKRRTINLAGISETARSPRIQSDHIFTKKERSPQHRILEMISENAAKIKRELEEKKRQEDLEKTARKLEKEVLKEKNEAIRRMNLHSRNGSKLSQNNLSSVVASPLIGNLSTPNQSEICQVIPFPTDSKRKERMVDISTLKNYQLPFKGKSNNQMSSEPVTSPRLDSRQRRISLGLECLNKLSDSVIQNIIANQKKRKAHGWNSLSGNIANDNLQTKTKRRISPQQKQVIQDFILERKRQAEMDLERKKLDQRIKAEKVQDNLAQLKQTIQDQNANPSQGIAAFNRYMQLQQKQQSPQENKVPLINPSIHFIQEDDMYAILKQEYERNFNWRDISENENEALLQIDPQSLLPKSPKPSSLMQKPKKVLKKKQPSFAGQTSQTPSQFEQTMKQISDEEQIRFLNRKNQLFIEFTRLSHRLQKSIFAKMRSNEVQFQKLASVQQLQKSQSQSQHHPSPSFASIQGLSPKLAQAGEYTPKSPLFQNLHLHSLSQKQEQQLLSPQTTINHQYQYEQNYKIESLTPHQSLHQLTPAHPQSQQSQQQNLERSLHSYIHDQSGEMEQEENDDQEQQNNNIQMQQQLNAERTEEHSPFLRIQMSAGQAGVSPVVLSAEDFFTDDLQNSTITKSFISSDPQINLRYNQQQQMQQHQQQIQNFNQQAEEELHNRLEDEEQINDDDIYFYNIAATYIQKIWRGYFTRKLIQQFYEDMREQCLKEENENRKYWEDMQKKETTPQHHDDSHVSEGLSLFCREDEERDEYIKNQRQAIGNYLSAEEQTTSKKAFDGLINVVEYENEPEDNQTIKVTEKSSGKKSEREIKIVQDSKQSSHISLPTQGEVQQELKAEEVVVPSKIQESESIENIIGVANLYQERYEQMKQSEVEKWDDLIRSLKQLVSMDNNQGVNRDIISELCSKYEANKNALLQKESPIIQQHQQQLKNVQLQQQQLVNADSDQQRLNSHSRFLAQSSKEFLDPSLGASQQWKSKMLAEVDPSSSSSIGQPDIQQLKNTVENPKEESPKQAPFPERFNIVDYQQNQANKQQQLGVVENPTNEDHLMNPSMVSPSNARENVNANNNQSSNNSYESEVPDQLKSTDLLGEEKFNKMMLKKESMDNLMKLSNDVISFKKEAKIKIIDSMFQQNKVTPQAYEAKKRDIEQWVVKEREVLKKAQHEIERGWRKFAETVRQTKRGINFIKQTKKTDSPMNMYSNSDENRLHKFLSFRSDSEASEIENLSKDFSAHQLQIQSFGVSSTSPRASIAFAAIKRQNSASSSSSLPQRPSSLMNGFSKSCTSWDGQALHTNNSEDVEFDDINEYLQKMKNLAAQHLPLIPTEEDVIQDSKDTHSVANVHNLDSQSFEASPIPRFKSAMTVGSVGSQYPEGKNTTHISLENLVAITQSESPVILDDINASGEDFKQNNCTIQKQSPTTGDALLGSPRVQLQGGETQDNQIDRTSKEQSDELGSPSEGQTGQLDQEEQQEYIQTLGEEGTQQESDDQKFAPIDTCVSLNSIKDFLVALAEFVKENFREEFLEKVNQPLGIEAVEFLKTFNITEGTEHNETETSNGPIYPIVKYIHIQKPVISEEIFLTFNELYQRMIRRQKRFEQIENGEDQGGDFPEDDEEVDIFSTQSEIEKYNLKLIFDCFNEALDFLRPFSLGGKPLPWKLNQKKLAGSLVSDEQVERVLGIAIGRTLKWGSCLCGFITEKIEFPLGQEEENKEYLNQIKEDRLAQMLENEVVECEPRWLQYEEEETDVQLEISDDIFHFLVSEVAQWLTQKMSGQLNTSTNEILSFQQQDDEDEQVHLLDYTAYRGVENSSQGSPVAAITLNTAPSVAMKNISLPKMPWDALTGGTGSSLSPMKSGGPLEAWPEQQELLQLTEVQNEQELSHDYFRDPLPPKKSKKDKPSAENNKQGTDNSEKIKLAQNREIMIKQNEKFAVPQQQINSGTAVVAAATQKRHISNVELINSRVPLKPSHGVANMYEPQIEVKKIRNNIPENSTQNLSF